jgi:hypothetical protein
VTFEHDLADSDITFSEIGLSPNGSAYALFDGCSTDGQYEFTFSNITLPTSQVQIEGFRIEIMVDVDGNGLSPVAFYLA